MRLLKIFGWVAAFAAIWVFTSGGCNEKGVRLYEEGALDGYTLLGHAPLSGTLEAVTILIDMLGNEVHRYSGVLGGQMLPGGAAIGINEFIGATGDWRSLYQQAWDGTLEWSFSEWEFFDNRVGWTARVHHDGQREGSPVGYTLPDRIL